MDDKATRLMEQLKSNPAMLQSLLQSRDGQALMQMLTQQDHGAALQRAAQSAMLGKTGDLTQMINNIMQSPAGADLVNRISNAAQK